MTGFHVDVAALRAHAAALAAIHERFSAIKTASASIFQADDAYGQLCQFLPPVLEGRHEAQDEGVGMLAENIELLAAGIKRNADAYERTEESATGGFDAFQA
ncbi:hypothetical protein [Phytomonospora endophytica]|uniref:ESX-1 secretion-associated protein n=1 Tax=Phytomonospora endophytica TaxID=714109 RepID=A0A841FIM0_9ACTN|nr:hypothetical protein [Phytomonospora endophytica]MBB6036056.1 hypothetical protein [Phytomonospora endophytica]GIG66961.1 hypothetical protein Pen01_32560 [Phytomonospora endophytica]